MDKIKSINFSKLIRFASAAICVAFILYFMSPPAIASEGTDVSVNRMGNLSVLYGIVAILSLGLLIGYCCLIRKKDIWFLLLYISVFVVNIGYFTLSISTTLEEAMLANRLAYLGSVFLPLCMLMIIMDVCQIRRLKTVVGILIFLSIVTFLLAASGGYLKLYYKEVSLVLVNGVAKLKKVYGPLHILYFVYLIIYFSLMVGVIAYSYIKKKSVSHKYAAILASLVLWNIIVWFVEQRISWEFEFLSVSYIVTELVMLMLYDLMQDYGFLKAVDTRTEKNDRINAAASFDESLSVASEERSARAENRDTLSLEVMMEILKSDPEFLQLTKREVEVLKFMLKNKKRKEIADELFVTENTIKKHTAHIFMKLNVSNRSELFALFESKKN